MNFRVKLRFDKNLPLSPSPKTKMTEIVVNGEPLQVPAGTTVKGLLTILAIPPERVAVELDRAIIKNIFWHETVLRPGAQIEIVHFVGGG